MWDFYKCLLQNPETNYKPLKRMPHIKSFQVLDWCISGLGGGWKVKALCGKSESTTLAKNNKSM